MKKLILPVLMLLLMAGTASAQSSVVRDYISRFQDIAMEEMQRTGVPAAITLAQGILETEAGKSDLVKRSNNHFGIKCKTEWTGEKVYHDDDARGECFRKYNDPIQSYRDHSDFLRTRAHYASLFKLDPTDYEGWAYGLKKAGYATNPKYPQILIRIIKEYGLQDYTLLALNKKAGGNDMARVPVQQNVKDITGPTVPAGMFPQAVFRINETQVVHVPAGTSYLAIAEKYDLPLSRLMEYNELASGTETTRDELVFLKRKRKTGAKPTHTVIAGETMYSIAQAEGIRLENLLEYNALPLDSRPEPGTVLSLDGATVTAAAPTETSTKTVFATERSIMHKVAPKETMYSISKKYNVSVEDIRQWNNLPSNDLKPGQQLRINQR